MRNVVNDCNERVQIRIKNAYGKITQKTPLQVGASAYVPTYDKHAQAECVLCESETIFLVFIYKGEGDLTLSQSKKPYDFKGLSVRELDRYLQAQAQGKTPPYTKAKIKAKILDFIELCERNANTTLLAPPLYEKLIAELVFGCKKEPSRLQKLWI